MATRDAPLMPVTDAWSTEFGTSHRTEIPAGCGWADCGGRLLRRGAQCAICAAEEFLLSRAESVGPVQGGIDDLLTSRWAIPKGGYDLVHRVDEVAG